MKPHRAPSLVGALLLRLTVPLLVIVAATAALGGWWANRLAEQTFDRWLLDSARSLAQQVRFEGPRARLVLGGEAESILAFDALDRTYYSVRQGGRLVAGHKDLPMSSEAGDPLYFDAQMQAQAVRVVRLSVPNFSKADGEAAEVYIAETRLKREEVRQDIQLMLIPSGLLLLVTAAAIVAAVRGTLAPVEALANRWLAQSHQALDEVDLRRVPRELQPLATALNRLFARLREVLARERRFTANAAHQIRTPLAGLQLGLARAAESPDLATAQETIRELKATTQRTARLVQQLLALSRLEPEATARLAWRTVDLRDVVRDVGQAYVQTALDRRVQFELLLPAMAIPIRAEPDLLSECLGNLVDNALRYASEGGVLRLEVGADPQQPWVQVDDAGPGIEAHLRTAMLERFARGGSGGSGGSGGPAGSSAPDGSGLGLSIAQDIAQLHGSALDLGRSELGGLRVRLAFAAVQAIQA